MEKRIKKRRLRSLIGKYKLYTKALSMLLTVVLVFLAVPMNIYAEIAEAIPEGSEAVISASPEETTDTPQREIYEDISKREINTKHFRLPDGSYVAAQYPYAVHYVAEDGSLVDINNALSDVGGGMYANESARVKFSKKINGSATLFELKDGNTKLTLSLIGANNGTSGIVTNGTDAEEDTELQKMMNLEALSSTVLYPDALDGVDLEYIVSSLSIKENIIVKEQKESYSYSFELKLNGLVAELSESGDVLIYGGDTVKYVIPSPVVYDASGAYAPKEASEYTLTGKGNGKYTLTVSVSAEWMNDGTRVFPVTVDPTIDSAEYGLDIEYAVTNSASPANALPDLDYITLSTSQTGYLRISQLPSIPANAFVSEAKLNMYARAFVPYVSIGTHFVTSSWDESLTYNDYLAGAGSYNASYLDVIDIENSGYIELDIIAAASRWYGNGEENHGISIVFVSDENIVGQNLICILSPTAEENAPEFTINYSIIDGVESYWPTISQSAGLAGVGTVNLATGALNFSIPLMSTTAPLMTFTPTLVYNSSMAGKTYGRNEEYTAYTTHRAPFGMMLNTSETVKVISYGENNAYTMMLYVDGDGTPHYFYPDGNSDIYRDEDGLGLKLWIYGNNLRIQDRNNNIRIFSKMGSDTNWYLSRIEDSNSNAIVFVVDNLYRVVKIGVDPYGESPVTMMLLLEYNSNGLPSRIYNPATYESFVFRYSGTYNGNIASNSGSYLRQIDFAQGTSSTTSQNWANFVSSQTSRTNITLNGGVDYRYNSDGTLLGAMERSSQRAIRYFYDTSK